MKLMLKFLPVAILDGTYVAGEADQPVWCSATQAASALYPGEVVDSVQVATGRPCS
jgi:hypothetical protein